MALIGRLYDFNLTFERAIGGNILEKQHFNTMKGKKDPVTEVTENVFKTEKLTCRCQLTANIQGSKKTFSQPPIV